MSPQAADGGRLDQNGQPCVPPLGRGAKAGFEDLAVSSQADAGEKSHTLARSSAATPTQNANFTEQHSKSPQSDELHAGMQSLSVNPAPTPVGASSTFSPTDASERRSTDTFASAKETLSVEDAPVVPTAEGPPAGVIVFDHPPTQAEQKHAEKLADAL
jgi:hypothetical protein